MYLVVVWSHLEAADVGLYEGIAVRGGILVVFDGTFDCIWGGEYDGKVDEKFDGGIEGEIDGINDTPVGGLDGVVVVEGNVSASYPLNKKPVNNKPFTYC